MCQHAGLLSQFLGNLSTTGELALHLIAGTFPRLTLLLVYFEVRKSLFSDDKLMILLIFA